MTIDSTTSLGRTAASPPAHLWKLSCWFCFGFCLCCCHFNLQRSGGSSSSSGRPLAWGPSPINGSISAPESSPRGMTGWVVAIFPSKWPGPSVPFVAPPTLVFFWGFGLDLGAGGATSSKCGDFSSAFFEGLPRPRPRPAPLPPRPRPRPRLSPPTGTAAAVEVSTWIWRTGPGAYCSHLATAVIQGWLIWV